MLNCGLALDLLMRCAYRLIEPRIKYYTRVLIEWREQIKLLLPYLKIDYELVRSKIRFLLDNLHSSRFCHLISPSFYFGNPEIISQPMR